MAEGNQRTCKKVVEHAAAWVTPYGSFSNKAILAPLSATTPNGRFGLMIRFACQLLSALRGRSFRKRSLVASLRNREVTSNTPCSLLDRIFQQRRQEYTDSSEIPNRRLSKSIFILGDLTPKLYETAGSIKYTLCSFQ